VSSGATPRGALTFSVSASEVGSQLPTMSMRLGLSRPQRKCES
jgi:hypothetical protein